MSSEITDWEPDPEKYIEECERMSGASGNVHSADPIVKFLYLLMIGELPPGTVEDLVDRVTLPQEGKVQTTRDINFTNGWLAQHAQDIARRLRR